MARETRPGGRPSTRGRTKRRPRTEASTSTLASTASLAAARVGELGKQVARRRPAGPGLTLRALVLFVVLGALALSYVGSVRTYLAQQHDLAVATEQIAERSERVAQLEQELQRWRDPAFVQAQARTRLGWVMPGETGYRVIGRDGKVVSGADEIEGVGSRSGAGLQPRWWERLEGSVKAADDPRPVESVVPTASPASPTPTPSPSARKR